MFGVSIVAIAECLAEINISIGKYEVAHKKESMYAIGFLNGLWAIFFLSLWALFVSRNFSFSLQSLPTFLVRAVFEIVLAIINLKAVCEANRSTFAFLHSITIPLLLGVDILLGFTVGSNQIFGIALILIAIIFISAHHGLGGRGKILCFLSAIIGVVNISLYKYNITHFNSVEAEQILMTFIVLVALLIIAKWQKNENLFTYLKQPFLLKQSCLAGIAGAMISFAYVFAPASIILTARRSFDVILATISGKIYFHEKHIMVKVAGIVLMIAGLILLV